jgi:O-antigen ligase/polysaccharide polymerase Wzy-like membrane protein
MQATSRPDTQAQHRGARRRFSPGSVLGALEAPGYAGWLLFGALAACAYAAFDHGATTVAQDSRSQLALAAGLLVTGVGIARGELGAARSPLAWAGAGLLACFAAFCALSVIWSIAPDESWIAANRAAEYAALVAIILVAAPSVVHAPEKALLCFFGLALVIALYALGGKIIPTVAIGPLDFDHASQFSRLRAPLDYWNALGMLLVLAVPACLWMVADPDRGRGMQLAALLGLEVLFVAIALTYSRGSLIALIVAIAVVVFAGRRGIRSALAALLAAGAAAVPVAFAFSRDNLSRDGVAAADRTTDGLLLGLVLAGSLLLLAGVGLRLMRGGGEMTPRRRRGLMRLFALLGVLAALGGFGILLASDRGPAGTISHALDEFQQPAKVSNDPGRLLSSNGSNRWIWWREAAGAFSDRPIAGWGAGSFPIIHNEYREYDTQVRSAHDVPLQFLAEGGLIGAGLALGAIALFFMAAVRTLREKRVVSREARIALLAAAAAWGVHCLIDWDWEIPGVTLPALAALAIAAAPWREGRRWLDPKPPRDHRRRLNEALAVPVGLTVVVMGLAFAVSTGVPALAEHKRTSALTQAGDAPPGDRDAAAAAAKEAVSAHDLNPLDDDTVFTAAALEQRAGDIPAAKSLLIAAARQQPQNQRVWTELLDLAVQSGDDELAKQAFEHRLSTDPLAFNQDPDAGAGLAYTVEVPPNRSPTAYGTPPAAPAAPGG